MNKNNEKINTPEERVKESEKNEHEAQPVAWCSIQYNSDGTYFIDILQHCKEEGYADIPLYMKTPQRKSLIDNSEHDALELVAWRTFDGEGGYDYRSYEDNENYAEEWDKHNPNYRGWVDPLYIIQQQRNPLADNSEHKPAYYKDPENPLMIMTPERAKFLGFDLNELEALYTAPPQRKPLTDSVKWGTEIKDGRVKFRIGVQSFTIDYDAENVFQLGWMKKQLDNALSSIAIPKNKPLTDEQIMSLASKMYGQYIGPALRHFVNDIEHAHGIKE